MANKRRKDKKGRVLKTGEYYYSSKDTYEFRYTNKRGERRSLSATTLDELRRKENELLKNTLNGMNTDHTKMTINDLQKHWLTIKRGIKDNTMQNYKYMYEQFVEKDIGNVKIKDLKRSDVRSFYNSLLDNQNLKVSTIDAIHTVLHQVIDLAVEDDYLRYNPADNALKELKKARNDSNVKRKFLTTKEQELFLTFLQKQGPYHHWYPIFTVMLYTGLRVGEVTGLRWEDIDLDEEIISVNHTLAFYSKGKGQKCIYAINTPKTDTGKRTIPMLPIVKEAFLMEKAYQEECEVECQAVVDGYTDFIFINRFGGVQHQGTLNKALRRIIRDCNYMVLDGKTNIDEVVTLPKFSNHSLRHTFTTRMCEAGVNIKAMQAILGHKDAETTLNIYASATKELKRDEMANLREYFDQEKPSDSDD